MNHVAIVGVGLIGGSFGLAIREAGFRGTITGVSSPSTIQDALDRGAIDRGATLEEALPEADLVYLAQPIGIILHTISSMDRHVRPNALVTDAGSTKEAIVSQARKSLTRCRFLGGHPLAGKEVRGAAAADAGLFRDRPYVLTPHEEAGPDAEFLELLHGIGARPVILTAVDHDRLVAGSSHVPQLASTALAAMLGDRWPEARRVAGPGLIDSTRLALSSYELWRDIVATNTVAIEDALSAYIQELEHLRENLRTRELANRFAAGEEFAKRLRT